MATFVMVHGAFIGGWAWERLTGALQPKGHQVHAPDLIGAGQRAAELHPELSPAVHADQIAELLVHHSLHDVILVGHSYGGVVVDLVAERTSERLKHLVYLDASIPEADRSLGDLLPQTVATMRERADAEGDGWLLQPSDQLLDFAGAIEDADRRWMAGEVTPLALRCFTEPVSLPTAAAATMSATYIACTAWPGAPMMATMAERARQRGATYVELPTGHYPMITMPEETARVLNVVADRIS